MIHTEDATLLILQIFQEKINKHKTIFLRIQTTKKKNTVTCRKEKSATTELSERVTQQYYIWPRSQM